LGFSLERVTLSFLLMTLLFGLIELLLNGYSLFSFPYPPMARKSRVPQYLGRSGAFDVTFTLCCPPLSGSPLKVLNLLTDYCSRRGPPPDRLPCLHRLARDIFSPFAHLDKNIPTFSSLSALFLVRLTDPDSYNPALPRRTCIAERTDELKGLLPQLRMLDHTTSARRLSLIPCPAIRDVFGIGFRARAPICFLRSLFSPSLPARLEVPTPYQNSRRMSGPTRPNEVFLVLFSEEVYFLLAVKYFFLESTKNRTRKRKGPSSRARITKAISPFLAPRRMPSLPLSTGYSGS